MCYLTVELLELVDECIILKGSIEGDELLEGEVRVCLLNIHPWKISCFVVTSSVADPDPGSGAFLTPGSGFRDG